MNETKKWWFSAKDYGWGWQPSSWQGWVILLVFIGFNLAVFFGIDRLSHSVSDTLMVFLPISLVSDVVLILICYRTGEKPEWRWGRKK